MDLLSVEKVKKKEREIERKHWFYPTKLLYSLIAILGEKSKENTALSIHYVTLSSLQNRMKTRKSQLSLSDS